MKLIAAFFAALSIAGCAALGLQSADTFNQKLAYSYGQVTAARNGAAAAVSAGQMAVEDAKHVQEMADQARKGLDLTKSYAAVGNIQAANTQLALEQATLAALQAYLVSKGVH